MVIDRRTISRHLGKIDVDIDDLQTKHATGVYRGKINNESYYYFQKGFKDPPHFPSPSNKIAWSKLREFDDRKCGEYMNYLNERTNMSRVTKKR